jgi:hypothetical protein
LPVHQGGVLEVLGPDAHDQVATGAGLQDLAADLGREGDVAEGAAQVAAL